MGELADYLIQHDANFRKARLPALYSDFRPQKSLNPDGYQANVSAWRGALSLLASRGLLSRQGSGSSLLVLDLDASLPRSLESRQFGQPLALGTVIREATAGRDLLPLHDFLHSPQIIYERSWSDLPWNAMYWALRQVGILGAVRGDDKLPKGRFVIVQNVEAASKALAQKTAESTSRFGRVFTKSQLRTELLANLVADQQLSDTDVDVLLKFLSRDKDMIEYDGQTIRFRETGEPRGITEEDAAIASIKELTASLKHQASLLDARINQLNQEAKDAVIRKNRITALAALKSKKLAESSLSKRYATLNQLEEVAAKIEQASDQVQLVNIMESSAGALRNLNAKVGGADRVDSVMDRLREQMNDTDEVTAILAESMGAPVDESEIDEELEALERQEALKHQEAQRREKEKEAEAEAAKAQKELDCLPSVPIDRVEVRTPTSETGIARLSLDQPQEETAEEAL
ncbi:snf7 domain-containing protein [Hirsutella rhossiliensis]|uniref:Snf7 domain-containing protein n=1 Tax=Hirsutella rhossiliensis TaxID=111463 RepID=A0A9P8MQ98_9HYPO|nr:snf7 domain-containing protein [Hirsutella rhossiliensis]KAH0960298.1 snf7 domain-containing protein [Hirsutella rhossiliensis]